MYLYIVAIIIIVACYFIQLRHNFWDKQPVMRDGDCQDIKVIGSIPNFKIKLNNSDIKFKQNISNLDEVYTFLNDNFNNDYNINYSYLKYCFNKKDSINISCYDKKTIIGFIHAQPMRIVFKKKLLNLYYVDYLCVEKYNRSKNLASLLISTLLNSFKNKQSIFLFKKDSYGLPYKNLLKTHYFYKDMREIVPIKLENVYNLSDKPENTNIIYNYYRKLISKFKMYNYIDRTEFRKIFIEHNKLDLYVINNENDIKTLVIGKKGVYKIWNKIENCFEIELILGEIKYAEKVDKILSNVLKNNGYNFYCLSNVGLNGKFIKDNNLTRSQRVYYYTYNLNLPKLKTSEFLVNLN